MTSSTAVPVLVGELRSDTSNQVEWVTWPLEVYPNGCLVRLRLIPAGTWPEYEDFRTLAATVQPLDGLGAERIVLEGHSGKLQHVWSRLPNLSVEPATGAPWEHAWTVEYWWPRQQWNGDALTLTWPVRGLHVSLPVDRARLVAAAEGDWTSGLS